MKLAVIIMALGAVISSIVANTLNTDNISESRISSAKKFNILSNVFIMVVTAAILWKYMDFFTIPRILLLITVCSYAKNKKRKRFCTPFWKNLRVTLMAYSILGGIGIAKEIIEWSTDGNYTNIHVTIIFLLVIPAVIALIIVINVFFEHLLTRRRVLSYYY